MASAKTTKLITPRSFLHLWYINALWQAYNAYMFCMTVYSCELILSICVTVSILFTLYVLFGFDSYRLDRLERHYQHVHLDMDIETLIGMLQVLYIT